ncbi:bifunctional ornithine acetyltransferase/N-acetylglutamate synthase [Methanobacterium aggregans]|uniref:bifunctional ornithine acetyltransferase/N-acetylglutamate synthase n=1 Tax=Methanobacterium aggregans TaxID=1615586 RepID=UPI001AE5D9A7|nr:bifunctional ornithine acetyltransferase/N-acetylglutamate synthase [Methanobacterium aggregans]MBP2045044.1 glutamate N-acetyltransferase/amino-acid N-acetyltransferase [Methanobacterium aggregans]
MKRVEGGICAVSGVKASGACKGDYGVSIIVSKHSAASAVFTSNKVVAAPVIITKDAVEDGKLSAVVANSGNANCFTGKEGMEDGLEMASIISDKLEIKSEDVAVASTGIIGRKLPMPIITDLINEAMDNLGNSPKSSRNVAEAIMTTDTFPKEFAVETTLEDGNEVRIGGVCKGSGMIAPNMGTMLCFITTDVQASSEELQRALKRAVDKSFNMVVVDGDVSTNDMVVIMANGRSGRIDEKFQEALDYLCTELAKMIAKDGEGATKFMEVEVKGAESLEDARRAAKAVVSSSLVKTAIFGADPNWGRIVAAVGYSGAEMNEEKVTITLKSDENTVNIVDKGTVKAYEGSKELVAAEEVMENSEINITVNMNLGEYSATAYGCDLSYDYVRINAEYST